MLRKEHALAGGLAALVLLLGGAAAFAADVVIVSSSFASGRDGWTANVPNETVWRATGGKVSGYIRSIDRTEGATTVIAPAKFRRNYRPLNNIGKITFYHRVIAQAGAAPFDPYQVRLSGPGGSATWTKTGPTGLTGWRLITAPLKPGQWTVTSGTWLGLLANVTDLQIEVELSFSSPPDIEGIDEIKLVRTVQD